VGSREAEKVEVARIVDQHRLARLQKETADQVEGLSARVGQQDLSRLGLDAARSKAARELSP
jgi:predicted amidohydrolase